MKGIIGLNTSVYKVKWVNTGYESQFEKLITIVMGEDVGRLTEFKQNIHFAASQEYLYLTWPMNGRTFHCIYCFKTSKILYETITPFVKTSLVYLPLSTSPSRLLLCSSKQTPVFLCFQSHSIIPSSYPPLSSPIISSTFDLDPQALHLYHSSPSNLLLLHPHEDPSSFLLLDPTATRLHLPDFSDYLSLALSRTHLLLKSATHWYRV